MNIDWFTFAAQVINFLVLVALLRWLLYAPIVRAMQERENTIAARLHSAEQSQSQADAQVREFERKSQQIEQQRESLLADARSQAQEEQRRIAKEARQEVERQRETWLQSHQREQSEFVAWMRRQAAHLGIEAARRTLQQLANDELERRMCDAFAVQLQHLDAEKRAELMRHLENGETEVAVHSAFPVSSEAREHLRASLQDAFQRDVHVDFLETPDLICGLEVIVGGYAFGWNAKDFLHDLDVQFAEGLKSGK